MAITLLPTPPSRQDPANFNVRADEFLGALPTFGTEANSLASDVNSKQVTASNAATTATAAASTATTKATEATNAATTATTKATEASNSATSAANSATTATTKASDAIAAANTATTKAGEASTSATNAAASASQAQIFATQQLIATSSTSLTPGLGSKSLTIQTSKSFVTGVYLMITSSSDNTHKMAGYVTSYNSSTGALVVNADYSAGTTAKTDWIIGVGAASAAGINLSSLYQGAYSREITDGVLQAGKRYGIWTGSRAVTMSLPAFADCQNGDEILISNVHSTWGVNPFTINCPSGVSFRTKAGAVDTVLVCNTNQVQILRLFMAWKDGTSAQWAIG